MKIVLASTDDNVERLIRSRVAEIDTTAFVEGVRTPREILGITKASQVDVVVIDDTIGDSATLAGAINDLRYSDPTCQVVLLSTSPEGTVDEIQGVYKIVRRESESGHLVSAIEGAARFAAHLRNTLNRPSVDGSIIGSRSKVIAVVGGKGGVGTTTIATHLAFDALAARRDRRVCLVDFDLGKGDVTALVDVRHQVSIADLAKVSNDLTEDIVADALVTHHSGLRLLLPPTDVRDLASLTQDSFRAIFLTLRTMFDLVIVDAGSHVTGDQAGVVDLADEVVAVVTPDVLCLLSLRRALTTWEALGIRNESEIKLLLNRVSRDSDMQPDTVRRLVGCQLLATGMPAMFRQLEPGLNARDPLAIRDRKWWTAVRSVGEALDPAAPTPIAAAVAAPHESRRKRKRRERAETGSITVETVALVPLVLAIVLICWQVALFGLTFMWAGHASSAASRAYSIGADVTLAARDAVPASMAGDVTVSTPDPLNPNLLKVDMKVPLVAPALGFSASTISSTRSVVFEP